MGLRVFVLLQQVVAEEEESTAERWEKVTELLKKCTVEQIQEAKGSITKAALHLEPSELVLNCSKDSSEVVFDFEWVAARTILEAIPKPEKVTSLNLNLWSNNLGPGGASVVGRAVAKFQQITHLKLPLGCNNIGAEGAKAVGDSLAKLEQITDLQLWLGGNGIPDEVIDEIRHQLEKPSRTLDVWS